MLDRQTVIPVKHETVGLTRCGASGMDDCMCGRCSWRKGSGRIASSAPVVLSACGVKMGRLSEITHQIG